MGCVGGKYSGATVVLVEEWFFGITGTGGRCGNGGGGGGTTTSGVVLATVVLDGAVLLVGVGVDEVIST